MGLNPFKFATAGEYMIFLYAESSSITTAKIFNSSKYLDRWKSSLQCMHHTNLSRTEFVALLQTNSDLQGRCRALISMTLFLSLLYIPETFYIKHK